MLRVGQTDTQRPQETQLSSTLNFLSLLISLNRGGMKRVSHLSGALSRSGKTGSAANLRTDGRQRFFCAGDFPRREFGLVDIEQWNI